MHGTSEHCYKLWIVGPSDYLCLCHRKGCVHRVVHRNSLAQGWKPQVEDIHSNHWLEDFICTLRPGFLPFRSVLFQKPVAQCEPNDGPMGGAQDAAKRSFAGWGVTMFFGHNQRIAIIIIITIIIIIIIIIIITSIIIAI